MKTALVTGASSGIGFVYAKELAISRGYRTVAVARRSDRLSELAAEVKCNGGEILPLVVDLALEAERERLFTYLRDERISVDLLVNNAGFGSLGPYSESDYRWERNMVEVNCIAPLHFMRHFLPLMTERGSGTILNVVSTCAFQPMPFMATYGATKAFLLNFGLAVAVEVEKSGVLVVSHCPGPTESEFHQVAGLPEKLSHLQAMTAEAVVKEALQAMDRRKLVVVNGLLNRMLARFARICPPAIGAKLVGAVLRENANR